MDLSSLLPCWVRYSRMGHNTIIGRAEHLTGQLIVITTPAQEPEERKVVGNARCIFRGTPTKREIVEVGGPAYYGMALLTDEEGKAAMEAARHFEYDYSTEAEEVRQIGGPADPFANLSRLSQPRDDEPTEDPDSRDPRGEDDDY